MTPEVELVDTSASQMKVFIGHKAVDVLPCFVLAYRHEGDVGWQGFLGGSDFGVKLNAGGHPS